MVAATPTPPAGAPNVLLVVLDDVGFAQLGCFGSDIDTPVLDGLAAGGLRYTNFHTTALCSPTRACLLTGRNHHSNGMGRVIELATGFPGYNGAHPARERLPPRDARAARLRRLRGRQVAPDARGRVPPRGAARDAGRSAAASSASTASSAARRTSSRRRWSHDNHQIAAAAARSRRATTSPRTWSITPSSSSRDLRAVDDRQAVLPLLLHRRLPLAAPGAGGVDRALPRPLRPRLGRVARGDARAPDRGGRAAARAPSCRRDPSGCRPWDSLSADERRRLRALHGGVRRLPRRTPTTRSAACSRSSTRPATSTTRWSSCCPTTAPAPRAGRSARSTTLRPWNMAPRTARRGARAHRRDRRPALPQQLPVGLDRRRQHAVPALEARGARGRRRRSADRPLAARHRARAARCAASTCTPSTSLPTVLDGDRRRRAGGDRRRRAAADRGHELRLHVRRRRARRARHDTQYYEMFGCRALYHRGWKAVTYRPIQDPRLDFDATTWELYDVGADPSRVPRPRRRRSPRSCAS